MSDDKRLPALGQTRSVTKNQQPGNYVDLGEDESDQAYNQEDVNAYLKNKNGDRSEGQTVNAETRLQMGDEAYESDGGVSALSKPPVPMVQEVQLPDVELEDLEKEDTSGFKWISRIHAVTYDDTKSECGADEDKAADDANEGANKSSMGYLAKQKEILVAQSEQVKSLLEIEAQKKALGAKSDQDVKPNKRFKYFNDAFSGLTRSKNVKTKYPIVQCIMSYNSKSALTITKKDDREHIIHQFSLESYDMTFEEIIGGKEDSYIKMSEIEQNAKGDKFAFAYLDDGKFKLRTFGQNTRSVEEQLANELDINAELGLDNHTMPINNFPDPFITCCFVNDDLIFVNLFHNKKKEHHHFFYHPDCGADCKNPDREKITQHVKINIDSNNKNFPVKCFYNTEYNEIYTFYRQGQSYRIPVFDIDCKQNFELAGINTMKTEKKEEYTFQDIYDKDLGQMFLVNETALVCRSSSQILFFKLEIDEFTGNKEWMMYHTLEFGGNIFHIKGTWRLQIVTEDKVFFYMMDDHDFMPNIENVMNNYVNCSIMMFGAKGIYGITYKTNEGNFDVYRRKYIHDYKVPVVNADLDGSKGLPVESMNAFLISKKNVIKFYDVDTFREIKESQINIPLLESTTREANEIISMQISPDEQILACISGKKLIMDENKPNQIFIFKRKKNINAVEDMMDQFELIKRIIIKDNPAFEKISMQFKFQNTKYGREVTHLLFARQDRIVRFDFWNEQVSELAFFNMPLSRQPEYFLMSDDQTIAIIASSEDGIYFNLTNQAWIDLDETFDISLIKQIIHDAEAHVFYILANKYQGKSGVFLVKFHELNPKKFNFFLKYKTKLDIADADIAVIRDKLPEKKFMEGYKELIVSYKTINENTYNVYIVDIAGVAPIPIFRHESFQLWESEITAFYLNKNRDFVMINSDGISLISLGQFDKRMIKSEDGQEKMIHAIQSVDYLKCNANNFIFFDLSNPEKRHISIEQQFPKLTKAGVETAYDTIYKIRLHEITLRELLFFQSLYVCSTQTEILKLVQNQPRPAVFFKSFLELDGTNMTCILAFDSRCMKYLLKEDNSEFFNEDYPLFYKNKMVKLDNRDKRFYRSAIDMSIQANQLTAVACILDYMVLHQNSFAPSSYLFRTCFLDLIQKGVMLTNVLNSNIFCFQFDYDEWPSTHADKQKYLRPFNGSIFELRDQYHNVFPDLEVPDERVQENTSKVFKISYELNTLPLMGEHIVNTLGKRSFKNEGIFLMEEFAESEELEVFTSKSLIDLLEFKWTEFGKQFHMVGCCMHFMYMSLLFVYINQVYIENNDKLSLYYSIGLFVGLIYPMVYEFYQIYRLGLEEYISDPVQSLSDQLYIWCGIANLFQVTILGIPFNSFQNKCLLTIILTQQIMKSFFYLRIFESLSYIVTMIFRVVADLQAFLLFFTILVFVYSMIFAVIGAGNPLVPGDFADFYNDAMSDPDFDDDIPNQEYEDIGYFFGYLFSTLRVAIGDFDFGASYYLSVDENWLYWITWLQVVVITCIIFLNFIIAEASASYESVKENLIPLINQSKASLIMEAEQIIPDKWKNESIFPRYVIVRTVDM